ncbi:MAG: TlpA family protein disulfide reductase [Candidatus Riflebacteria bacterium]|nr:TlpA family protein disulfide reductase [Candidatus Riflebacteria bacterium]
MNRNQIVLLVIALLTVPLIWFFIPNTTPGTLRSLAGVTLSNLNGDKFKLSSVFSNKKILLVFWSITCGSCIEEIPFIIREHSKFKEKLTIIGVHPPGFKLKKIQKFVKTFNTSIPYLLVIDDDSKLSLAYGVDILPKVVLIDEKGRELFSHVGYEQTMEKEVEDGISGKL